LGKEKMKKEITDETRRKLVEGHFSYEVRGMMSAFNYRVSDGRFPNIVYVGLLTHMRNLLEFFYKHGNGDKAHAEHFIPTLEIRKFPPEVEKENIQINNFLSHLSYVRVTKEYKHYKIDMLYNHLRELIINFLRELELQNKYFTQNLKKLLEEIK